MVIHYKPWLQVYIYVVSTKLIICHAANIISLPIFTAISCDIPSDGAFWDLRLDLFFVTTLALLNLGSRVLSDCYRGTGVTAFFCGLDAKIPNLSFVLLWDVPNPILSRGFQSPSI